MSDMKWFKFSNDFFGNRKIKNIKRMRTGDKLVMNWLRTLCIASKINDNGLIYLTPTKPYSLSELADEFDCKISIMKQSIEIFEEHEMISVNNGFITVLNWEKYQNTQGLDKVRKQTNERVKKHRELKKCNADVTLHETLSNATDKNRIDKNRKEEIKDLSTLAQSDLENHSMQEEIAPVIELTLNDKTSYGVTDSQLSEWQELYQNVNVMQQLKNMKGWLDANPTKRKTQKGILRFINSWLVKEQDKFIAIPKQEKEVLPF